MKKTAYLLLMPMLLMGCQTAQMNAVKPVQGVELKQPEAHVLCDQYICANDSGISRELTQKYLGQDQADKVFSKGQFNRTQFAFANGIFCDVQAGKCYVDRYFNADGKRSAVAENYSKALFGQEK